MVYHLNFYENDDIEKIIRRNAKILNVEIDNESCEKISTRARRTPRVANRLLKRVRDYCEVKGEGKIEDKHCKGAFEMLEVDKLGLDWIDRKILEIMIDKFQGGPVGLNTIAAASGEDMSTIEDVYEPYLMRLGFINRSPRGRMVTDIAYKHLKRKR